MKKKLLVSFSGGETSAYMAQWLWKHKQEEYEMVFVFANTGQENEETLEFVQKCSDYFGFSVVWVEAVVFHNERKSSGYRIVSFETADRSGKVFEEVIKKYTIPHQQFPHCTREMKQNPIKSFAKEYWNGYNYFLAIGIRSDEADRINRKAKEMGIIYPLINNEMQPMTKPKINFWWSRQPFRLNLKGYQGNCKTCWKKSDKKLFQIAQENPEFFDFNIDMEKKYGKGKYYFFRGNRSAKDILAQSKTSKNIVVDDSRNTNYQLDLIGGESCEVWSECSN